MCRPCCIHGCVLCLHPAINFVCYCLKQSVSLLTGAFLLASGQKVKKTYVIFPLFSYFFDNLQGKRYSLPNSRIMIHQPLGGAQGQAADIEIQANEIMHHKSTLNGYLAEFTGKPLDTVGDTER
mmetsp:Transcript_11467/g.48023  ORF Transcript_11467/g.48023 Transcript_11467/m.48023 type:complete len:124 (-) Transcript_11467:296-667(-)